tara:strand:- start:44 stop:391 length:348 start_codon:yes stop_codon:yes gene_type:complete
MAAEASQLAQVRPSDTNATLAFTATIKTEITALFITNTTGTAATYSVYHDDDGTTYDQSTALYYQVSLGANETKTFTGNLGEGITLSAGGKLAVQSGTSSALTYTFYGITAQIEG